MNQFATQLRALRTKAGVTRDKLAGAIFVGSRTVTSWETGRTEPSFDMLVTLADYFGTSTDEVLGHYHKEGASCES